MIREVLDALATPAGPDDTRTLAQRRAEVLKDLFAQALTPTGIATEEKTGDRAESTDDEQAETTRPTNAEQEPRIPSPRPPADDPAPSAPAKDTAPPSGSAGRRC